MTPALQILLFGSKRFDPTLLFKAGQTGWNWQFDNPLTRVGIAYEWTDTAGTTPVTAVGQGIGLLLGREYGGATGPSLLANGAAGLTGTATAASYSTTTFAGSVSRAGDASNQSWVTWTGLTTSSVHRIRITNSGATSLDVRNGGVAGTIVASVAAGASTWVHPATTGGSTSITITATTNSTTATFTLGQFAVLPGTHLTQATGTARPTLSARVNQLLATEALANAAWVKTGSGTGSVTTVTDNYAAAPDGTTTATRIVANKGAGVTSSDFSLVQQVISWTSTVPVLKVWIKSNTGASQTVYARTVGTNTIVATTSWQLFTITGIADPAPYATFGTRGGTGSDSSIDILVWHPDLRTADDAAKNFHAYQRVGATAADHDTDGFPHYALHDGTDDAWASVATVDGSSTDKVSFVAAVTKLSDAADGTILSFGDPSAGDNGTFIMQAPGSAAVTKLQFSSRGTAQAVPFTTSTTYNAPVTMVAGAVADIGAPLSQLSVNGVTVSTITTTQGTGNYNSAKSISVGQRIGGTARFNGRFYGSTGRFGPMSDSERNNLTRWWQKRIGTA